MDAKSQVTEIVLKHSKAAAIELIEQFAIPALKAAAARTETPIDDIIVAALEEPLRKELLKLLAGIG